ncbi:CAP-Gly domain-containing linker protein 1-like isoform X3 [Acanthaster planci]|uniref:CAP-Gly domain-containing linker protein 1-like isoform X3 n=1 Tax=Acanthaster planci TaxID=133434 RepID=A0A8B7XHN3_ACAPL|nr:CAP-Gly domain-containing linker protein 1-like isoform X3 [Acanthaster planci]
MHCVCHVNTSTAMEWSRRPAQKGYCITSLSWVYMENATIATQVESRLPAAGHRQSLLKSPKPVPSKLKSPELKPLRVSPTSAGSGIPQRSGVLQSKHLLIGQRVWTADGRVGTLEFKGKTHFSQGCLCGIRLDEPLGKHDGSVDGIQYFKCSPSHGIFIHAFKVQAVNSAGEVKPLELAPNTSGKLRPSSQPGSGKESKPSSKIPALGVSGKIARPKSLLVTEDKAPCKVTVGRKSLPTRSEVTRIECFSSEKAPNSSKLFQKKRISPADSGITVPGWTHDKTLPTSRLPSIQSKSPSVKSHDATFTLVREHSPASRPQPTERSPASQKRTPEQSSPRVKKSPCGSLKKGLSSRPSLNDLTQLLQDDTNADGEELKLRRESGSRPKTNLNETFEVRAGPHRVSPITGKKKSRKDTASSATKDLNLTFDVEKKASPLSWEPGNKVTSTPVSSSENTYFWESDGIPQSDVRSTYDHLDTEEDDIEYNEFWAVPSTLDTPTGRLRFDLLTPEEFEQALKDCNIPLESPQNKVPPTFEETFTEPQLTEPQLTDHCKPKILDALTVVDDDLLVASDSTSESIPSFLVPAWSMDSEATNLDTSLSEHKDSEDFSEIEQQEVSEPQVPTISRDLEAGKVTTDNRNDLANNNIEVDPTLNNAESTQIAGSRTRNNSAMNEFIDKVSPSVPLEKSLSTSERMADSTSDKIPRVENTLLSEDDQCIFTDDLSNEWKNLVQQAEEDLGVQEVPQTSNLAEVKRDAVSSSNGPSAEVPTVEATDLLSPNASCHTASPSQETFVKVSVREGAVSQINPSSGNGEPGSAKAVSPAITLNILNATFDSGVSPEKEKSFASEGSSESASTVIGDGASENDHVQNKPKGMRERCPSAELETVTQFEMAEMTSPSYSKKRFEPETFNAGHSQQPAKVTGTQKEPQRGKENSDHSKLPRKRTSYLQQPKSFSSNRDSESSSKSQVAAAKLKLAAAKPTDSKPDAPTQDSKPRKGHTAAPWKLISKNPTATTSKSPSNTTSTIPKQKATETGSSKDAKTSNKLHVGGVRSKIDTGRKSVDLTGNKPTLTNKKSNGQNSTSSLEVEPNSLSSSNRSMKSDLSGVGTRTSSRSSSIGGKPANKTTLSLRHTDRARQERKTSTSTVNSEVSQRTESRASLSSRLSSSTSDAKHHAKRPRPTPRKEQSLYTPKPQAFSFSKPSRPAPVSLAKPRSSAGKQTDGNQSKNDSQLADTQPNGLTAVDAAPVRRPGPTTRLPRTSLLPSKKGDSAQHKDSARRPSVGKEAETTKSTKGRSSPSPAPSVDPEILAKAQADVKRLEALCESRTKELNLVKLSLRNGLQGLEAMTILVQYLTQTLDAFDNPHLKCRIQELQQQLEEAKNLTAQKEEELGCIQRELVDTRRCNEEQVAKLQTQHLEQLKEQEERLNSQHEEQLQTTQSEHKQAMNSLKEENVKQISELTSSHHQAVQEMEEHHIEEVSKIQQQHQEHIEELNWQVEKEKKQMTDQAQVKQQELNDEIYKWTFQCENLKERVTRLEEALQKDSDSKVQAAILEKRKLEADVESLKSVEELRTNQLIELRRENMALKKDLEQLPAKEDEIQRLKAKVEDQKAMIAKTHDYQQQLSSDHITLRENYEREVNEKKRLSMEKEQLSWRLSLHSESSSPVSLSPGHTFFPCTSPSRSPTRSPNPSPSVLKQNLSRSSSMESHESGVFSPQNG